MEDNSSVVISADAGVGGGPEGLRDSPCSACPWVSGVSVTATAGSSVEGGGLSSTAVSALSMDNFSTFSDGVCSTDGCCC